MAEAAEFAEAAEAGLFEIINTTRAMKRLKPDPVPLELIRTVLDAGTKAPSGENTQLWEFVVIQEADGKQFIQERYQRFAEQRFRARVDALTRDTSPPARMLRTLLHLAEHLHEAPVLLLVCGHRDWPASVPPEQRVGQAPPPYGSIYPCVQNILLACRALGLGASLTTIHHMFEEESHARFGIPDDLGIVALLPIGYPHGKFGPVSRQPAEELTHFDTWGKRFFSGEGAQTGVPAGNA